MSKIIIIGAGLGGLALAIRLQAANIKTLILEKRSQPGGRAYVYKDKGFIFDAGPTVITDPKSLEELFNLSGKNMDNYLTLLHVKPFYKLSWQEGHNFYYYNNKKYLEQQILNFNPLDIDGYRRFFTYSQKICKEGYQKLGSRSFLKFCDMLKICPKLIKFQAWRSVYSRVSKFIKNEYLRQVFSFHSMFIGGNPFTTSSIYTLIHALEYQWGVWFPRGGTNNLVSGLVKLFKDLGGKIELNACVKKLHVVGKNINKVSLVDGRSFTITAVASNADVIYTYEKLLGHHHDSLNRAISLKRKKISYSLFIIYFGLNKQYSKLVHHTILFGLHYKKFIDDISYSKRLSDDFSIYLHAPCVTDLSLAPPGCSSYYVLTPVQNLGTATLDWTIEGPILRELIFDILEKKLLPGLRKHLVTYKIFTPFNFRDELNSYLGSAFSLEPLLTQSAWFRPHHRDNNITNLYLVGAGTHPGAGIPGVISSAKATANLMLNESIYY